MQAYETPNTKHITNVFDEDIKSTCLTELELWNYITNNGRKKDIATAWLWHISDLKIYDKPKELEEFYVKANCAYEGTGYCLKICPDNCLYRNGEFYRKRTRPPMSWYDVEDLNQ